LQIRASRVEQHVNENLSVTGKKVNLLPGWLRDASNTITSSHAQYVADYLVK